MTFWSLVGSLLMLIDWHFSYVSRSIPLHCIFVYFNKHLAPAWYVVERLYVSINYDILWLGGIQMCLSSIPLTQNCELVARNFRLETLQTTALCSVFKNIWYNHLGALLWFKRVSILSKVSFHVFPEAQFAFSICPCFALNTQQSAYCNANWYPFEHYKYAGRLILWK